MAYLSPARRGLPVLILSAALVACSGTNAQQPQAAEGARQGQQQSRPAVATAPPEGTVRALPDFAPLVERYGPAVVNVEVVQQGPAMGQFQLPPGMPEEFGEFFRRFGPPQGPQNMPPARGAGSGFIISPDGYILTNAHVVANAEQVTVQLTDRREYTAKVIGADTRSDVALLKIEAKDLPTVEFGNPERLRPGEWVLAIGSPFGFENSATAGIVSATARGLPGENQIVPFIQTDVAVNPGNSGGPLFNMRGEVVGINSQIYSRTGGYQGVSFAIPIDVALDVQEQLRKHGRVIRGRIGVTIQEVTAQLAQSFGLDRPRGALVASVEEGGPAGQAGIMAGDVILEVNGETVERSAELPAMIAGIQPGNQAKLVVWRNGERRNVSVQVAELEPPGTAVTGQPGGGSEMGGLGLAVRPLTAEERQQLGTQGSLVVERVSGPAAAAGVLAGDVILGVNGTRVKSMQELQAAVKKSGDNVALLVQRGDAQIFIPVRRG